MNGGSRPCLVTEAASGSGNDCCPNRGFDSLDGFSAGSLARQIGVLHDVPHPPTYTETSNMDRDEYRYACHKRRREMNSEDDDVAAILERQAEIDRETALAEQVADEVEFERQTDWVFSDTPVCAPCKE